MSSCNNSAVTLSNYHNVNAAGKECHHANLLACQLYPPCKPACVVSRALVWCFIINSVSYKVLRWGMC